MAVNYQSWGRYPPVQQTGVALENSNCLPRAAGAPLLAYGLGRSYGDVCLNSQGVVLDTQRLGRFLAFDRASGVLRCEAGVSLAQINRLTLPVGWFLPVTPGTQFVTMGGAVANDVHGKNHHKAGTFGHHVRALGLLRSNGDMRICSLHENADWFRATVGGLGLTGLIQWVEIQLIAVNNPLIQAETIRFANLDEFFALSLASESAFDYTVAWLDCLASGKHLGRGLFMRGNHAAPQLDRGYCMTAGTRMAVPVDFPGWALNHYSIRAFNWLYYRKQWRNKTGGVVSYLPFFYPLDSVGHWNRIYGKRGFFQYQCVVPYDNPAVAREILQRIAASGQGSFLGVMKLFGDKPSLGLLSFPRKGFTLALDFANHGESTLRLFAQLDDVVAAHGGVVYPAKDARMSARHFQQFYPAWETLQTYIDPQFSSDFWRRVTQSAREMC